MSRRRAALTRLLVLGLERRPDLLGKLTNQFAFRKLVGTEGRTAAYRALGARIGKEVAIGPRTTMRFPGNVTIGDGTLIGAATIEAWGPVTIGCDVMINSDVSLFTAQHDIDSPTFAGDGQFIEIGDYAWLPHHVRVLPGVRIGRCAVIGTGSVVTSDVPDYAVATGNPARVAKERARIQYTYRASALDPAVPATGNTRAPRHPHALRSYPGRGRFGQV